MNFGILFILGIVFGIQLLMPKTRINKSGFFGILSFAIAIIFIFGFAGYQSWQQYFLWKNSELGKFFLPPYQKLDYFVFYSRTHFFNSYFLSLLISLLFLSSAKYYNQKHGEKFFEPIELYLLAISIFLAGHPAWLFYLIILLTVFLIINFLLSTFYFLLNKEMPRISLYYLWLPVAISTILINGWLSRLPWWQTLKF